MKEPENCNTTKKSLWHLRSNTALYSYLDGLRKEKYEWLLSFFLGEDRSLLGVEATCDNSHGGIKFDYRHLLRRALLFDAKGIILAHNHPSGEATASVADMRATAQFASVSKTIGIPLLGHYVVSRDEINECGYW